MFIHRLSVNSFKPFKSLGVTIEDTPRLVVACGQNGTGKSSLIDAISLWRQQRTFGNLDPRYYTRGLDENAPVSLTFHWQGDGEPNRRSAVYVRSAQRVSVDFAIAGVGQPIDILEDPGPRRTIDLDQRVEQNYMRLIAQSVTALWDRAAPDRTTGEHVARPSPPRAVSSG